jgi:hypothetical protein
MERPGARERRVAILEGEGLKVLSRVAGCAATIVLACGATAFAAPTTFNGASSFVHAAGLRQPTPYNWQPMQPFERMPVTRHRKPSASYPLAQAPRYRTVCPTVLQYGESAGLVDPSSLGNCRDFFSSLNQMVWGAF